MSLLEKRGAVEGRGDEPVPGTRAMWIPLIAVILVLATLAVAPITVSVSVRRKRGMISDVIDPARLRATDLAAALAEEMSGVGTAVNSGSGAGKSRYVAAVAAEERDSRALDSLVRFLGADAQERFGRYQEAETRWRTGNRDVSPGALSANETRVVQANGLATIDAIRRLISLLDQLAETRREQVRRVERIDVFLPAALFPLALLACVLVIRAGRRTADIAIRAERDRRALGVVMDEKSALMRGISHDLQNPLGAAIGHLGLILDGIVRPEKERDTLLRVRRLVTTASETVTALLSVARSEVGELRLTSSAIDLCSLVEIAVDDHKVIASAKQQTAMFSGPPECRANGDVSGVRQIIDNLLSNASKYTPVGGRIRVIVSRRSREDRMWATVTVEDSGTGIPTDWHDRVFDEFARVPRSRDSAPGHGIGLSVSRRVARMMGGDLTLATAGEAANGVEPLGGASFTLWLPTKDASSRESAASAGGISAQS